MHASTVLSRTRSDDRRSAPNSALRRTRADAGQTGRVIGLCCPGSATVVPNSFSTTGPSAGAAASARGATNLAARCCQSHSKLAPRARDVTGPARPLYVPVRTIWCAAHKLLAVYGLLFAVTLCQFSRDPRQKFSSLRCLFRVQSATCQPSSPDVRSCTAKRLSRDRKRTGFDPKKTCRRKTAR
jgi:hypothetical protein